MMDKIYSELCGIDTANMSLAELRIAQHLVSTGDYKFVTNDIDEVYIKKITPQTVKVRILVGIDSTGYWTANGWENANENILRDCVIELLGDGEKLHWVTADIPLVEDSSIDGEVSDVQ
jgi:hypothetical protein